MTTLTAQQAATRLTALPNWKIEDGILTRSFEFKDFLGSLAFVNRVGEQAEKASHHPDIDIRYNRVRLGLISHDAGGLTVKDFDLAAVADSLAWPHRGVFHLTAPELPGLHGKISVILDLWRAPAWLTAQAVAPCRPAARDPSAKTGETGRWLIEKSARLTLHP